MADHEAMLVFGDEAIGVAGNDGFEPALDLGEEWTDWTGLPFVYALWAGQRGEPSHGKQLREAKAAGLANLEELIQHAPEGTVARRRDYLTRCIRYDLGAAEKAGIRKFQEYLRELRVVEAHELRFVD